VPIAYHRNRNEHLIALIDRFHAMWNTQHVSGVLQCFSEDAVVSIVCPQHHVSVVYRGRQQLRAFVRRTIAGCVIRARSHHVVDDRVIWMATVANDHLRQLGVDSVRNRDEAVIRDEKIAAYTVMVTAETVAKLEAVTALSAEQLGELGA
jgi:ketosteroid isomerase-like protein